MLSFDCLGEGAFAAVEPGLQHPETFGRVGTQSAVQKQPGTAEERLAALQALVSCPTSLIGSGPARSSATSGRATREPSWIC